MKIVVVVCSCGRAYSALAWAQLAHPPSGAHQDAGDGTFLVLRNCAKCGSTRALDRHEDMMCVEIWRDALAERMAWAHARLALASARLDRASGKRPHLYDVGRHRIRAHAHRADRHLHEQLLAGMYRARELRTPHAARGRRLELVTP